MLNKGNILPIECERPKLHFISHYFIAKILLLKPNEKTEELVTNKGTVKKLGHARVFCSTFTANAGLTTLPSITKII